MVRLVIASLAVIVVVAALSTKLFAAGPPDIVLHAASFAVVHGNWSLVASASSPDGAALASQDRGWDTLSTALASPEDYVQAQFSAPANTPYRVWLRLRATADSKWNDSVWVQFSDAVDETGAPEFQVGTTAGLLVNLESCYACGDKGWGWQDRAWWTGQRAVVQFASSGPHIIRIQTREDGVMLDQVVLSPASFFARAPGADRDDQTIVPIGGADRPPTAAPSPSSPASAAPPAAATSRQFAALTWNIEISSQDVAGARRQMDEVAGLSPRPAVVVLQEARGSLYSTYTAELSARTGQAWNGVFQGHCARDAWDSATGVCRSVQDEGVLVLTTFPIVDKNAKFLPYADCWHSARAAVRAVLDVRGVPLEVYGVHLQTGTCTDAKAARLYSIAEMKMWISRSAGPAVVAGDFNEILGAPAFSDPSTGMLSSFTDAWSHAGSGPGLTFPVASPDRRIDYWLLDHSGKVSASSARVVTSAGGSDHYPVMVELAIGE